MEFLLPLTILGLLFVVWNMTARSSILKGESKILSYLGGVGTGLLAAAVLLIVAAPKEEPDTPARSSQEVELPLQDTEIPQRQERPPPIAEVAQTSPLVQRTVASLQPPPPIEARKVSSLPDAPALPLALPVEEAEAQPLQEKSEEMKEPSLSNPTLKKSHAVERLVPAPERLGKLVKPPQALPPRSERQSAQQGPFQLSLTATAKEVWIQVSIDGGPVQRVRLAQGKSVSWTAKRGYKLSLDDAGGVRANLNGKPLPGLGRSGQSRQHIAIPSRRTRTSG